MNLIDQLRIANGLDDLGKMMRFGHLNEPDKITRSQHLDAVVQYVKDNEIVRRRQIKDKFNYKSERQITNDIQHLLDNGKLIRVDKYKVRAK